MSDNLEEFLKKEARVKASKDAYLQGINSRIGCIQEVNVKGKGVPRCWARILLADTGLEMIETDYCKVHAPKI